MRIRTLLAVSALVVFAAGASAEKKFKPWTEWNLNDAMKVLNDSPWGQTQIDTNISEMSYSPTTATQTGRAAEGAFNQATSLNLRIRLLSAKPIRQALTRTMLLQQKTPNPQLEASLKAFVDRSFDEFIVVSVDYDSADRRLSGPAMQSLSSAVAAVIRNNTYLELKNGKRLFLQDYNPPGNDGLGAKFIFPRKVDGQPFVSPNSGDLRFYSEVGKLKLNMRFKVSDFMYEGVLEH